jgi:hypothetical protein
MSRDSFRQVSQAFDRSEVSDRLQIIEQLISIIVLRTCSRLDLSPRKIDKRSALRYKLNISSLSLREQGARRTCAASAFLIPRPQPICRPVPCSEKAMSRATPVAVFT